MNYDELDPVEPEVPIEDAISPRGDFFTSDESWKNQIDNLAHHWHVYPGKLPDPGVFQPWTLLPGCLDEPLIVKNNECLSNVCTHKGALLLKEASTADGIRCPNHGRRFDEHGKMLSAPGFKKLPTFPNEDCGLPRPGFRQRLGVGFVNLDSEASFEGWWMQLDRIEFLLNRPMKFGKVRNYDVKAHWVMYIDNYLEGLHIPYVHRGLAKQVEMQTYEYELLPQGVLQTVEGSDCFDIPEGHQDHGRNIAAYYYFLFPCTMLNFYPWGISVNVIQPRSPNETRVTFFSLIADESRVEKGAGSNLDIVEWEDEEIVESVAKGLKSRLYKGGRYSPKHEKGVHHFHKLFAHLTKHHFWL